MSAKEMFEKLGYEEIKGYSMVIYNSKRNSIRFWSPVYIEIGNQQLSVQVLQAINKQVEELGWGDK